ncbi:sugar kinase [Gilvimarinus agarilyticus]|uniref:sugar kinase n=1 Tax=Gilvimarinus agarilyticus TaxID=679259 RepID=UPI0005A2D69A|nr:sugar kinase [Gilvimarinus agarilyticus]
MSDILIFGESMLELTAKGDPLMRRAYAGDVFSVAVYLARLAPPELKVKMLSAIGRDTFSQHLRVELEREGVDTRHMATHPSKHLGLYMVQNDASGEREFTYWRSDSAARDAIKLNDLYTIPTPDYLFFSGISLAILDAASRFTFKRWVSDIKKLGTTVIFDANFRPALWQSESEYLGEYRWAFAACQIALPGMDDLQQIFRCETAQQARELLSAYDIPEIIIKNGADSIVYRDGAQQGEFHVPSVEHIVDTTAAGDSFNAAYLASRIGGSDITSALAAGCRMSAKVIGHSGAIIANDDNTCEPQPVKTA